MTTILVTNLNSVAELTQPVADALVKGALGGTAAASHLVKVTLWTNGMRLVFDVAPDSLGLEDVEAALKPLGDVEVATDEDHQTYVARDSALEKRKMEHIDGAVVKKKKRGVMATATIPENTSNLFDLPVVSNAALRPSHSGVQVVNRVTGIGIIDSVGAKNVPKFVVHLANPMEGEKEYVLTALGNAVAKWANLPFVFNGLVSTTGMQRKLWQEEIQYNVTDATQIRFLTEPVEWKGYPSVPKYILSADDLGDIDSLGDGQTIDFVSYVLQERDCKSAVKEQSGKQSISKELVLVDDSNKAVVVTLRQAWAKASFSKGAFVIVRNARVYQQRVSVWPSQGSVMCAPPEMHFEKMDPSNIEYL